MELGLEFAVSFNHNGSVEYCEEQAQRTIELFCGENAQCSSCYAFKDGKPLIVAYVTREWFETVAKSDSKYLEMFTIEWASGEDSDINKWGWQVEPFVGPMSSTDSMFITPSIKWAINDEVWRKSLAWMDFCFYKAEKMGAAYRIVGSFDDIQERNCWYVADTSKCQRGEQMRDIFGVISTDAYYKRVEEWIKGKPTKIEGGMISDGVYRIACPNGTNRLTVSNYNARVGVPIVTELAFAGVNLNFCFYHLGNGVYRIVKLNSGLSLQDNGELITQEWDDNIDSQKFIIEKNDKYFAFKNIATNNYIAVEMNDVISLNKFSENCRFTLECIVDYSAI